MPPRALSVMRSLLDALRVYLVAHGLSIPTWNKVVKSMSRTRTPSAPSAPPPKPPTPAAPPPNYPSPVSGPVVPAVTVAVTAKGRAGVRALTPRYPATGPAQPAPKGRRSLTRYRDAPQSALARAISFAASNVSACPKQTVGRPAW